MPHHSEPPLTFAFGLHAHQPVGNFDHVFREHISDVYEPFLDHALAGGFFPLTLHLSGTLLDWLEANRPDYLDRLGRMVSDGQLELLLAGYYEPILPSLSREDRIQQVLWMKETIQSRFGVDATGLWLTERVWEPDLPADLVEAGVEYVLVDDRHFVASGFRRDQLHTHFRTEASGKSLAVFPIDEKLRYYIPFQSPDATAAYLRDIRSRGHRLAVFADDIEKFGGWPGTREWVYEKGWLDRFMAMLRKLQEDGEVRLTTFRQALQDVPGGGPAYLPSASYREMEEWSLPASGFRRLAELREILGEEEFERGESPLIRGSHWRNFLVKYPESNRMHKKMMALSALCRERGDPEEARRALGKAQCNDSYWHGVFGGLYLRHLRDAVWQNLADAEGRLRQEEELSWEKRDLDLDGQEEIWIHSLHFSATVSPARGGGVEELTLFHEGVNLANTLTRRREAYHTVTTGQEAGISNEDRHRQDHPGQDSEASAPSIHDMEERLRFDELPPIDPEDRRLLVERILRGETQEEAYRMGRFSALHSWGTDGLELLAVETGPGDGSSGQSLTVRMRTFAGSRLPLLEKTLRFFEDGSLEVHFRWEKSEFPPDSLFTTEISLGASALITPDPGGEVWRFPISTFSKSEKGFDETVQGESVLIRWPVSTGGGSVRIGRD